MKRVVLDVSAIRSTPYGVFARRADQFEFMVSDKTLAELYTHGLDKGGTTTAASAYAAKLLSKMAGSSSVVMFEGDPIRFEVEKAISARFAPVMHLCNLRPEDVPQVEGPDLTQMLEVNSEFGSVWSLNDLNPNAEEIGELQKTWASAGFWAFLTGLIRRDDWVLDARRRAVTVFWRYARDRGWEVSNQFFPMTDWWTFGWIHVARAYCLWKLAKHGSERPTRPENIGYDMHYVVLAGVCDGLLSSDLTCLNMAWACWPEKRAGIYTYDVAKADIIPYRPTWQT